MTVDLISQSQARFGAQMLVNVQDVRGEAAVEEVEDQAPRQRLRSIRSLYVAIFQMPVVHLPVSPTLDREKIQATALL